MPATPCWWRRLCRDNVREADIVIRWGGEEFLLLLPRSGADTALAVAERVRAAIEQASIHHDGGTIAMSVSIGAATAGAHDADADDVVRRADQALYQAKRGGRNRVVAN
jgi:diguanylate cyclase (GGDEF)-like protein